MIQCPPLPIRCRSRIRGVVDPIGERTRSLFSRSRRNPRAQPQSFCARRATRASSLSRATPDPALVASTHPVACRLAPAAVPAQQRRAGPKRHPTPPNSARLFRLSPLHSILVHTRLLSVPVVGFLGIGRETHPTWCSRWGRQFESQRAGQSRVPLHQPRALPKPKIVLPGARGRMIPGF